MTKVINATAAAVRSPFVFAVDGERGTWKQLAIIRDGSVHWIEFTPALLAGWNVARRWQQGQDDWPEMSAAAIIAWKMENDSRFRPATEREYEIALRLEHP